ncbi:hypothetical protein ACEZCY_32925 [Streptacidiphilus sp. N1-12]|uniref:Uncharacterized protein n=2 Tax=Streptacidiphilus alkalitolerans TaxID=3342712 RepID=A0ABV6WQX5_9ACTN
MSQTHTHPHESHAQEAHTHAPLPAPSREGSVVLEIGGDLGALILHTGPEQDGLEIEVSPLDDPSAARTHAAVRPRHLAGRTVYCAVISPLRAGRYTVWRDAETADATVQVPAGGVAEHRWA